CRDLRSSDRGRSESWGRPTKSHRSDGEQRSNLRLGTRKYIKVKTEVPRAAEAGLYTGVDKGRLCALVRVQLVRAQHADAALGAGESERLRQRSPSCAVHCRPI
ncbi:hypothetical protein POSPLADRAFT_1153815, partial [Postia placenta MAD-698-R-SB12]